MITTPNILDQSAALNTANVPKNTTPSVAIREDAALGWEISSTQHRESPKSPGRQTPTRIEPQKSAQEYLAEGTTWASENRTAAGALLLLLSGLALFGLSLRRS
jgi:hypothetical protein